MVFRVLLLAGILSLACLGLILALDTDDGDQVVPEFSFLRLMYSSYSWGPGRPSWAIDYPKADKQFLYGLRKLVDFTFVGAENKALPIMDPGLFDYPFVYAVEVGNMELSQEEADRLREYLLRGGFLVVDDFHGPYEYRNFYNQIRKVFPEYEPFELSVDHPIFHCYYSIDELIQVPGYQFVYSGQTWEKGGYEAHYMGIKNDEGRLMVMINHNVDLGDAWEWAEREEYPREYANLAFQLGINYIIYAMTH